MTEGKVWLVGAGPGSVGLLTLKGKQVLTEAQVVVYDSLVGPEVLALIPEKAERIYVGKRANQHTMPQQEINQILLQKAKENKCVVRLKGGDPFLFGRGGEELELLSEYQIPYEVVPGITSPIAVPAYNGIPVTHREYTSSLHIVTGHKKQGESYDIDFEALVRTKGTLVFLMGVSAMEDICQGLLNAGMNSQTPAAILQQGTTARQKRVVATVSSLKEEADRAGIQAPAVIVVGEVCVLEEKFAWYEKLPLAGYRVLITRPKELISSMANKLRMLGAEVLELPSIKTVPLENQSRLHQAFESLKEYQWIVFTSPTGVRIFFEEMKNQKMDVRKLGNAKIAVIGKGTRRELEQWGMYPDLMPEIFDGEHLGEALADVCSSGDNILIPRAKIGNQELIAALQKKDVRIEDIPTYDTVYETQNIIDVASEFENGNIDCAVFTSASTVKGFVQSVKNIDYSLVTAACIGKQTRAAADAYGMQTFVAEEATMDSLVELVVRLKECR